MLVAITEETKEGAGAWMAMEFVGSVAVEFGDVAIAGEETCDILKGLYTSWIKPEQHSHA